MHPKVKEHADAAKEKLGLGEYRLETYRIHRKLNLLHETEYILTMEWHPNRIAAIEDGDTKPVGSVSIDLDFHTGKLKAIQFTGGKTLATAASFPNGKDDVISWVEKELGLKYGRHFQLESEAEGKLSFFGCLEGIPLFPRAGIEIHLNKKNKLIFFQVTGFFPSEKYIAEETFELTYENTEELAKSQLTLFDFPCYDKLEQYFVYGFDYVYIRNDRKKLFPFNMETAIPVMVKINKKMEWETPLRRRFFLENIAFYDSITAEEAIERVPHPDLLPLTSEDQEKCINIVRRFLRQMFPDESGEWTMHSLYRQDGYIRSYVKRNRKRAKGFSSGITVYIDPEKYEVVHYLDNRFIERIFTPFDDAEEIVIPREEAFEKLKGEIALDPIYLYVPEEKRYVLCGKFHCRYGIRAGNGEKIDLIEL